MRRASTGEPYSRGSRARTTSSTSTPRERVIEKGHLWDVETRPQSEERKREVSLDVKCVKKRTKGPKSTEGAEKYNNYYNRVFLVGGRGGGEVDDLSVTDEP